MTALLALLRLVIPAASAAVLEQAGSWTVTGQPNQGVQEMWIRICSVLPFCGVGPAAPLFFATKVINFVLLIITGLAVLMLIYAGIRLVASQGESDKLEDAKKIMRYALSGIVLALMSMSIVTYVQTVALPQLLQ